MKKISVKPSSSGLWRVEGLGNILRRSQELEHESWPQAAEMRFAATQQLMEAIGDEDVTLDWNDGTTRSAMELIYAAAADQLIIGETETATALWEVLQSLDEEDHMNVCVLLAFCYVELEDFDCWEEAMFDISTKSPEYHLLTLWATYRRTKGLECDALRTLRTRHKAWYEEFVAKEHPIDDEYLADCRSERPSAKTEARELWFATEALWQRNSDFIELIR